MDRARWSLWTSLAFVTIAAGGFLWATRGAGAGADAVRPLVEPTASEQEGRAVRLGGMQLATSGGDAMRASADRSAAFSAAAGPRRALEIHVIEALTRRPVEGALARLSAGEFSEEARSDETGIARIEWPLEVAAALEVTSERYVDVRRPVVDLDGMGEIALVRSGGIAGRVDARARGVETGPARLWRFASGNYRGEPLAQSRIDENGRFAFAGLAPGSYAIGITPRGAPTTFESGIVVAEGLTVQVFLGMTSGILLRGRIVQARSGAPISGVVVSHMPELQGINDDVERLAGSQTISGPDGRFEIAGLSIGQVDLAMRTPWGSFATRKENITPDGQARERTISIIGPAHVSGRVVDVHGSAVGGASVYLLREGDARSLDWSSPGVVAEGERAGAVLSTVSDSLGRFEFPQAQAAHTIYVVAWSAPGAGNPSSPAAVRLRELREGQIKNDVVLRLVPGLPLAGRVVDAAALGVPGVTVEVRARLGRVWAPSPSTVTGPDGRFAFASVPQADLEVRAEHPGHHTARARLRLREDTEPVELELRPAWRVRGHVVDMDGNAVPGAWVRASQRIDKSNTRRESAVCDDFGRFELDTLGDGDWLIEAYATNWRTPRGAGAAVTLPGDPFITLVMEQEASPPPSTITGELVWAGSGGPVPGLRFDGMRGGSVTLEGARFRITGVRPGRLQLVAKAEGMETVGFGVIELAPGGFTDIGRHEVRRVGTVRVKVFSQNGQLLKAKVLLARLPEENGGRPRGPDRYELKYDRRSRLYARSGIARYRWELLVIHSKYETLRQRITVQDDVIEVHMQPRTKEKSKGGGG